MIASWMLYTLMLGTLVVVAAVLLESGLRLLGRPVRGVWAVAVGLAVSLPLLTALRPAPAPVAASLAGADSLTVTLTLPAASAGVPSLPAIPALDTPLLVAWALLSLLLLAALLHGVGVLQGRRREWQRAIVDGREVLVAPDLGPAVIGWRRMQVVLPAWVLQLDAEARELILAHEEEHIRRRDPLVLLGGLLAALVMPWNAPLWYLYRRLRLALELDCDARVVGRGADLARYGEVLLVAGARCRSGRLPALATFAERATQLEARITALTPVPVRRRWPRVLGAGALAVAALAAACTIENPLGLDLTDPTLPAKIRFNSTSALGASAGVRAVVEALVDQQYPGAVAAGGVPVELVVGLVVDASQRIVDQSVTPLSAMKDSRNGLTATPSDQVASIEVMKGAALGLENVSLVLMQLKADTNPARRPQTESGLARKFPALLIDSAPVDRAAVERPNSLPRRLARDSSASLQREPQQMKMRSAYPSPTDSVAPPPGTMMRRRSPFPTDSMSLQFRRAVRGDSIPPEAN